MQIVRGSLKVSYLQFQDKQWIDFKREKVCFRFEKETSRDELIRTDHIKILIPDGKLVKKRNRSCKDLTFMLLNSMFLN